ncbi:hypothetical protein CVT24_006716 [Panaeolus cyanescens]|uniref:Senescence domain-containing protein n=1 Tax=Panaeolus cyanescens TaxID=181874 RepID=A0A409V9F8_9AGAR|nr:hypothetical protein CVT24_006716 [Panaeolus cyanescens]
MVSSQPEAFVLVSIPNATLAYSGASQSGVLSLECVTMPHPDSNSASERDIYLVLRLNEWEIPLDPSKSVKRTDNGPDTRVYTFLPSAHDPTAMVLTLHPPPPTSDYPEVLEKIDTFDSVLQQYSNDFQGPLAQSPVFAQTDKGLSSTRGEKDLRGHLVMINEDTGEVVGEVENRFKIREDPLLHQPGHENDPVVIEVPDDYTRTSDANAIEVFAQIVPPDQQNWITKSASIVSHTISMTTNLLLTTVTAASNYYINHSQPSTHHSANASRSASGATTPTGTGSSTGAANTPPPLPPRALVFLTSESTRQNLSKVHAFSGQAVKVSSKTVGMIDSMIRRAIGAKPKREKYFAHGLTSSVQSPSGHLATSAPIPGRPVSPSPSTSSGATSPPAYAAYSRDNKPPLPPRGPSPAPPLPARANTYAAPPSIPPTQQGAPAASHMNIQQQPRLTNKDRILISADLILSTIDDSTRRVLDTGTEQIGKIVNHKYGPEAAHSSLLMAGTARNVGLVYIDMSGIGRRALLKRAGKTYVKSKLSSRNAPTMPEANTAPAPLPTFK